MICTTVSLGIEHKFWPYKVVHLSEGLLPRYLLSAIFLSVECSDLVALRRTAVRGVGVMLTS